MAKSTVASLDARVTAMSASLDARVAALEAQVTRLLAQSHRDEAPAVVPGSVAPRPEVTRAALVKQYFAANPGARSVTPLQLAEFAA